MTEILHISDLHFVKNADSYNMRSILLKEATQRVQSLPEGSQKLLIITGDFHNYNDHGYSDAITYLKLLFDAMRLDPQKDVFVIPGNHDVGNDNGMENCFPNDTSWRGGKLAAVSGLSTEWVAQRDFHPDVLALRMKAFLPYCQFVRDLGIYPKEELQNDPYLPARVHVRRWRDTLNILYLNTALIADGTAKDDQLVDVNTAASPSLWKDWLRDALPALAIGHNSFYDLEKTQRGALKSVFAMKNVSAYLCGDTHRVEIDDERKTIPLEGRAHGNRKSIPNLVCAKSVADMSDNYSDFGYYWHQWNENSGSVKVDFFRWDRNMIDHTTLEDDGSGYVMLSSAIPMTSINATEDLGALLHDPVYSAEKVSAFFDRMAVKHSDVSSYAFICDIHRWFLPHQKDGALLKRMQELLEKDLRKNESGFPVRFLDYNTMQRDFIIFYCLGFYCKRQNKVDRGNLCLKKLLDRYRSLFTLFSLSMEVEGWYYRRKADRASKEDVKRQNLQLAENYDRKLMDALSIEENAGIYNSFASTVSKKLEYEYDHKNRELWETVEERMKDWNNALSYMPQIIKCYKAAWHTDFDYGKHHFILGKLLLFAPNSRTIDLKTRRKQIAQAKEEFYAANDYEESDTPDCDTRRQEYEKYVTKCDEQEKQLEDVASSIGIYTIRCDYSEQTNRRPRLHKPNEDYQLRSVEQGFFVLADGVTRPHSEYRDPALCNLAAECARELCQTIQNSLLHSHDQGEEPIQRMKDALVAGNRCVHKFQKGKWESRIPNPSASYPPCCALLLALFLGGTLYFYNCCDTVGYLVRGGVKMRLTDHYNWLAERKGYPKTEIYQEIHNNPAHPAGFGIVNGDERFEQFLQIGQVKIDSGDRVILSTDGLSEFLCATNGSKLREMTAEDMIQMSATYDQAPFRRYADDKSCVIIDIL